MQHSFPALSVLPGIKYPLQPGPLDLLPFFNTRNTVVAASTCSKMFPCSAEQPDSSGSRDNLQPFIFQTLQQSNTYNLYNQYNQHLSLSLTYDHPPVLR